MGQPSPQPFRMHVADETLRDLRERLMRGVAGSTVRSLPLPSQRLIKMLFN
jgi:hypothetical protein